MAESLLNGILRAETLAARIEAMMLQDPVLGGLWRLEASLTEAVRSVALEDIPLRESDLVIRLAENRVNEIDARGAETAMNLLRGLRIRGLDLEDPADLVRRVDRAVQRSGVDPEETEEIAQALRPILAEPVTPILTALRAAAVYATLTDRAAPIAERLIFVLVEGALRNQDPTRSRIRHEAPQEDLSVFASLDAAWVTLPGTALLRRGFRTWSPASSQGMGDFIGLIATSLEWELGAIGELRAWLASARAAAEARHGRSRRADLIALLAKRPILSSGTIADELGVTRRTALNLLDDGEELGLLVKVTPRGHSRLWASRTLAKRLGGVLRRNAQAKPGKAQVATVPELADEYGSEMPQLQPAAQKPLRRVTEEDEEAMSRAFAGVDDAMRAADAILSRYGVKSAAPVRKPAVTDDPQQDEG